MNQTLFWLGVLALVLPAFIIGNLINKIAPANVYVMGGLIFLLLYGWIICNLYTRLLANRLSFEKYRNWHAIVVAIPALVSLFYGRSEFVDSLMLILIGFIIYSNGVLGFFGISSNLLLLKTKN